MVLCTPSGHAAADTWCESVLVGNWDGRAGRCTMSFVSRSNAQVNISLAVPAELMDDPVAGPTLRAYVLKVGTAWRDNGQRLIRDNNSFIEPEVFTHSDSIRSVVFHEQFHTLTTKPNNAYRTFTFDLRRGRQLELADLFRSGVDPLIAIPPLARPYLEEALAQAPPPHPRGSYPFVEDRWQPRADGSGFAGDYRAFALTADELILYMPDRPMLHENPLPPDELVWSMDGGTVTVRLPLVSLASILSPDL